jgi:hypothetical protein
MKVITIGKRLVPAEQVAFVEPFDPSSNPEFKPEKDFKGRVVLLNREIVLTEQTRRRLQYVLDAIYGRHFPIARISTSSILTVF